MPTIIPMPNPANPMNQQQPSVAVGQPSARDRAIAKLTTAPEAPQNPVSNPSKVAPEEISALNVPSPEGQPRTTEEKAPEAPAAKVEEEPISSQYAVLARKEKAFRAKVQQQEAAIRAQKAEVEKMQAELKAKDTEYQSNYIPKDRLTNDTINTLLEAGVGYDQITQMMLNNPVQQDPTTKRDIAELRATVKAQADLINETKKAALDTQTQQYQDAIRQITRETEHLVASNPEFESIKETKSTKDVVELIEKTFKEDGYLMTVEEAAKEVEDHLVEQLSNYAQRINKIRQRLQPKATAQAPKSPEQSKEQPQVKTLTNDLGTARKLSAKERAILAFQGKLNK